MTLRLSALLVGTLITTQGAVGQGTPLYSESFDSDLATAKVTTAPSVTADVTMAVEDFSALNGGVIPEGPGFISGGTVKKGLILRQGYNPYSLSTTGPRFLHALLTDSTKTPTVFSGDYQIKFDAYLAVANTTSGTTEVLLYGIGGQNSTNALGSYLNASTSPFPSTNVPVGAWGWISNEGGIGTTGDASLFEAKTALERVEDGTNAARWNPAFLSSSLPNDFAPNNTWMRVLVQTIGNRLRVSYNGIVMHDKTISTAALSSGVAYVGYEDPFTGSNAGGTSGTAAQRASQFVLVDNILVEEALPLDIKPTTGFPTVYSIGASTTTNFSVTNLSASDITLTGATFGGANPAEFGVATQFPIVIPGTPVGGIPTVVPVEIQFSPQGSTLGARRSFVRFATSHPSSSTLDSPPLNADFLPGLRITQPTNFATVFTVPAAGEVGGSTVDFALDNFGDTSITINAIAFEGTGAADFSCDTTLPTTILAGSIANLTIRFNPQRPINGALLTSTASFRLTTDFTANPNPASPAFTAYRNVPGFLAAHYRLDEASGTTIVDAKPGGGANGFLTVRTPASSTVAYAQNPLVPMSSGKSIRLTAADSSTTGSYITSPVALSPSFTVSMWVKPEAITRTTPGPRTLFQRDLDFGSRDDMFGAYINDAGAILIRIGENAAGLTPVLQTADGVVPNDAVSHIVISHQDLDGWDNFTATRTAVFVNGELKVALSGDFSPTRGFPDYPFTAAASVRALYIGSKTTAGAGYLGLMDDIQIYGVALPDSLPPILFANRGATALDFLTFSPEITFVDRSASATGFNVTLRFKSLAGAKYAIQSAPLLPSIGNGFWSDLIEDQIGDFGETTVEIPQAANSIEHYFRVSPR